MADVILLGVSRSGKTPTCLYLALQYGIYAANYPLTDEEFERGKLPDFLMAQKQKLFGLTILKLTRDGGWYPANGLMLLAPSAFIIIGLLIWAVRTWKPEQVED